MAEDLLRRTTTVVLLATSREPLGALGEVVRVVASLDVPDPDRVSRTEDLAGYSGVQLLVDRAAAGAPHFTLTDDNAADVARLCFRLDGLPLAIELAAGRLEGLSVEQIVERLDNRFALLRARRRGGLDRQQTLEATLDWSYELLLRLSGPCFGGWAGSSVASRSTPRNRCAPAAAPAGGSGRHRRPAGGEIASGVGGVGSQTRRLRLYETVRVYARQRLGGRRSGCGRPAL